MTSSTHGMATTIHVYYTVYVNRNCLCGSVSLPSVLSCTLYCMHLKFVIDARLAHTFHERTDLPDGDDTFTGKLTERQLEKEHGDTGEHQHHSIRDEEST